MLFVIKDKAVAEIHENVEQSPYLLEVLSTTDALVVKSPPCAKLICIIVSLKLKNGVNNFPYVSNALFKFSNILRVHAYSVTKFYAVLTFCINLICNDLFKIVFLLETTFIFPHQPSSREVCMVYSASYWLGIISRVFQLGAWEYLSMVIIL